MYTHTILLLCYTIIVILLLYIHTYHLILFVCIYTTIIRTHKAGLIPCSISEYYIITIYNTITTKAPPFSIYIC